MAIISILPMIIWFIGQRLVQAQFPPSPCPNDFAYHYDTTSDNVFGYVTLRGLQPGENNQLDLVLSFGTLLSTRSTGYIKPEKSTNTAYKDITDGNPVQYWVVFPVQNPLPLLVSIVQNGRTICTGAHATGFSRTTISLRYTIYPPQIIQPLSYSSEPIITNNYHYPLDQDLYNQAALTIMDNRISRNLATTTAKPFIWERAEPVDLNDICGKPNGKLLNKLSINGKKSERKQFPWIVPLFERTGTKEPFYVCGSTIISRKHLITAAHCVESKRPEEMLAIPGMYNIEDFFDPNAVVAEVESIKLHEDFRDASDTTEDADIAILRLKKELVFSEHIVPICVWRNSSSLAEIVNHKGVVSGWGLTEAGSTTTPYHLISRIASKQECSANRGVDISSNARVFCGDGNGSVPCNGDSGSGLVMERGNRYYLRGVVSSGVKDGETLKCDVEKFVKYTDVAQFRYWIKQNLM